MEAISTIIRLAYGNLCFYNGYVIVTMNEGATVTLDVHKTNEKILLEHFKDTPFVYIANRVHSYSVDVLVYREVSKLKNLLGEAVVAPNVYARSTIDLEKKFMDKPFERFTSLENAIIWAQRLLENET